MVQITSIGQSLSPCVCAIAVHSMASDRDRLLSPSRGGRPGAGMAHATADLDDTLVPAAGPGRDIWDAWHALTPYVQFQINGVDSVRDLVTKMADGYWLLDAAEMVHDFETGRVSSRAVPWGSDEASCDKRFTRWVRTGSQGRCGVDQG
jgi:hypothetical protein